MKWSVLMCTGNLWYLHIYIKIKKKTDADKFLAQVCVTTPKIINHSWCWSFSSCRVNNRHQEVGKNQPFKCHWGCDPEMSSKPPHLCMCAACVRCDTSQLFILVFFPHPLLQSTHKCVGCTFFYLLKLLLPSWICLDTVPQTWLLDDCECANSSTMLSYRRSNSNTVASNEAMFGY